MAVLFSGPGQPGEMEATALLHTFQQRFAALCAVVHSVVAGGGPTLHSAVIGAVTGLLSSCEAFLDDLRSEVRCLVASGHQGGIQKKICPSLLSSWSLPCSVLTLFTLRLSPDGAGESLICVQEGSPQLPQRVGVISERCEAVKRIPLNNAVALGRKLTLVRNSFAGHQSTEVLFAAPGKPLQRLSLTWLS